MTSKEYCIVITTFTDDRNGQQIIDALLAERLAACVQVLPIQSFYHWQGKVNCDAEKLVLIKTKCSLYAQVQQTILSHHAYEVPEIIQVPITDGLPAYLNWISKECRAQN
ncbi:MAG: divalent cation tolerance protein [Candidatus Electronema aureum]|uniref:Divalent cation tolerance protein n=1 Tax=Candidatus Electronema aureum TaxID=2005002 RepID=A0A521G0J4_9BACT|nr:MAG: divalent cation tolerance protein [Candidatus Electronema aureum]